LPLPTAAAAVLAALPPLFRQRNMSNSSVKRRGRRSSIPIMIAMLHWFKKKQKKNLTLFDFGSCRRPSNKKNQVFPPSRNHHTIILENCKQKCVLLHLEAAGPRGNVDFSGLDSSSK
jgi:hypothetical protein